MPKFLFFVDEHLFPDFASQASHPSSAVVLGTFTKAIDKVIIKIKKIFN